MAIYVLQLNQLGKEEDEKQMPELYHWAQMFRANKWEELRKAAEGNEEMEEFVFEVKKLTADERARMELEARRDYYRRLADVEDYGIEQGVEHGIEEGIDIGKARALVSNIDNAMKNLHLSLEEACAGLGTTQEAYLEAKEQAKEQAAKRAKEQAKERIRAEAVK